MGIREIRFCDISGVENDVNQHVLQIDQMCVEIDLSGAEYSKLLEVLGPYIDAGRVEASVPNLAATGSTPKVKRRAGASSPSTDGTATTGAEVLARSTSARGSSTALTPPERDALREWAQAEGIEVASNNRFKATVIEKWRAATGAGHPNGS